MNTKLEKLFESYNVSPKDRHEFTSIYNLLPNHKKVKAIENFENIMRSIGLLQEELVTEQEILFGKSMSRIEQKLFETRKQKLQEETVKRMGKLKASLL